MENQETIHSFFRFEDLRVYHKALDYFNWIQIHTEMFPNPSSFLVTQFLSDSMEIVCKITEGSSRDKAHFIDCLKEAKVLIRRCVVYTTIAFKSQYFSEEEKQNSRNNLMELTKMIGALIGSLQRDYHNAKYREDNYENQNDD